MSKRCTDKTRSAIAEIGIIGKKEIVGQESHLLQTKCAVFSIMLTKLKCQIKLRNVARSQGIVSGRSGNMNSDYVPTRFSK